MEAVAPGDEIAVDPPALEHDGRALQPHVGRLGDDGGAAPVGGGEEILLQVRLPVGDEALPAMPVDVDQEAVAAGPDDAHAVVHVALAIQALGEAVLAQHVDRGRLEHAGADAAKDVSAAVPFHHDRVDTVPVQDLGEQQPGGTGADDADLRPQSARAGDPAGLQELLERLAAEVRHHLRVRHAFGARQLLQAEKARAVVLHRPPVQAPHHVTLFLGEILHRHVRILQEQLALLAPREGMQEAVQAQTLGAALEVENVPTHKW
jgi:hypothetical protein